MRALLLVVLALAPIAGAVPTPEARTLRGSAESAPLPAPPPTLAAPLTDGFAAPAAGPALSLERSSLVIDILGGGGGPSLPVATRDFRVDGARGAFYSGTAVDVKHRLELGPIVPFARAGVGVFSHSKDDITADERGVLLDMGGGFEMPLGRHLSIGTELDLDQTPFRTAYERTFLSWQVLTLRWRF